MRSLVVTLTVATFAAVLAAGTPLALSSQIPGHEIRTTPPTIRRMILSASRYYTTVKLWQNEVRQRTSSLLARTEELTRQKEALESKYLGNLTALGSKIPVINGLSGQCTRNDTAELVCDAISFTRGNGLERIVGKTYLKWKDTVLVSVDKARDDALRPLLGVSNLGDGAVNKVMYGADGIIQRYRSGQQRSPMAAQALASFGAANASGVSMTEQSVQSDSLDAWVQRIADSTANDATPLSMTRGLQLQLRARLNEAALLVTSTRSAVHNLEAAARNVQRTRTEGRLGQRLPHLGINP